MNSRNPTGPVGDHLVRLDLIDMGTEEGGAFPIHNRIYEAIRSSKLLSSLHPEMIFR
ncbi:hypothetical protein TRIP_B330542 [uncultured Desulfatiglans sp.]|uniref:Uncharacterized protein n=1 Tax=Uncultured Desulfatiglans sp. TaxID=1748965 RepID=A0A653A8M4_UNCDX|nr:hypothetical protein TRIP_B330542 [uncultured Desulfatiglans sp.]